MTITNKNLFSSILLLIIGILLLTSSSELIKILSYIIGTIFIIIGIVKFIIYYKSKKQALDPDSLDLVLSIISVIGGLVLIFVPSIIDYTIRFLFGGWILISGINRLILSLTVKSIDSKGFKIYLISSLIMILIGIFVLFNLFNIVGIYLILYSISDIVGYIYSASNDKINNKTNNKKKKRTVKKSVKEKKAIDAEIVE